MVGRLASVMIALAVAPAFAALWTAFPDNSAGWEIDGCSVSGTAQGMKLQAASAACLAVSGSSCDPGASKLNYTPYMKAAKYSQPGLTSCYKCDYWFYSSDSCCDEEVTPADLGCPIEVW